MKKIFILILLLIAISCTPKETGKAAEIPTQTEEIIEVIEEPTTCCCELPQNLMFILKTDCYAGKGKCTEDSKCLEKKKQDTAKKTVDIAMGKKAYPASDLTERTCCLVKLDRTYEKAFDTTKARCRELKGTEMIWEKCYEEVCCDRMGRIMVRKFLDCKKEGGDIIEMNNCR